MKPLTDEQEEEIKYLISNHPKMHLVCRTTELLIKCYKELERERVRSERLKYLCDICKEKGG